MTISNKFAFAFSVAAGIALGVMLVRFNLF